jgi:acyl-CoA synthetase (NDP forming)
VPVDLVVVCVPADQLVGSVTDALAAGARSLVVITAGLSELGAEAAITERQVVRLAREAGAVLVGPNCLGVVDTSTDLQLTHDILPAGEVAVLSQSGNLALDLAALLSERGLGVSRFVSVGNQADVGVVDVMASCVDHDATRAVAVYVEDVVDGRHLMAVAQRLRDVGKPVVLISPGRSAAAVRGAASHTGALTTGTAVLDAACSAAGIHRVGGLVQMADLLEGLAGGRFMAGSRVAVLTDGGGHGAVAADALANVGLDTPLLADGTRATLRTVLREGSSVANPVDLAGAGEQDPMRYTRALEVLLRAEEVDGVLMTGYFGTYSGSASPVAPLELAAATAMAGVVAEQAKPLLVQSIEPASPTGLVLRAAGIPVHRDVDRAATVLRGLVARPATAPVVAMPPADSPIANTSYDAARRLFAEAGVPFAPARTVLSQAELDDALESGELGFPAVLKALGRLHKSDDGGVVLGLRDAAEVRAAYSALNDRLAPPSVSVESMVDTSHGVEVIVGCVQDPRFGPVLMVGLGGVHTEVLDDKALAIAPVTEAGALALLLSLRAAPLLLGARGRDPVDLEALSRLVSRVSYVAAAHPELAELELNPVHAGPTGAVALDVRVIAKDATDQP